jgi:hypothetical protein
MHRAGPSLESVRVVKATERTLRFFSARDNARLEEGTTAQMELVIVLELGRHAASRLEPSLFGCRQLGEPSSPVLDDQSSSPVPDSISTNRPLFAKRLHRRLPDCVSVSGAALTVQIIAKVDVLLERVNNRPIDISIQRSADVLSLPLVSANQHLPQLPSFKLQHHLNHSDRHLVLWQSSRVIFLVLFLSP